jgi:hypothetical protein
MRAFRRITLPVHALIELIAGLALVVASLAFDMGATGTVLTFAAGVTLAGIGFGAVDSLSLAAHQSLDRLLAIALAAAAIAAATTGNALAAVVLLSGAILQLVLTGTTRWTRTPLPY